MPQVRQGLDKARVGRRKSYARGRTGVTTPIKNVTLQNLIDAFVEGPDSRFNSTFHELVAGVWNNGENKDPALSAARALIARADEITEERKGYMAILLGLLAEAEYPVLDGPVTTALRGEIDHLLDLWRGTSKGQPLSLALQYLLAQFPLDRSKILPVAGELRLDVDDMSRLERALRRLDPDHPVVGRAFPYPGAWVLDDQEQEFDREWIASMTPDEIEQHWHNDTHIVRGYLGAKAYWAVQKGEPTPPVPDMVPPRQPEPVDADPVIFARHADVLRCPACANRLSFSADEARCYQCSHTYPIAKGILDLTATSDADRSGDFLFQLATTASMGYYTEAYARPNFKRLCGFTWDGPVTADYETRHILKHVRPVEGPVLDIAAGAGGWTKALVEAMTAERVIALDLVPAMLATLRHRLPQVPAIVASATKLPFHDETLGAALCWNSLQAFLSDAPAAIDEVGRCLRVGGTFTIYTFRNSPDPVYRYFVAQHRFPQHQDGLRLFELSELKEWLARAGMKVREEQLSPGLAVFITAEKVRLSHYRTRSAPAVISRPRHSNPWCDLLDREVAGTFSSVRRAGMGGHAPAAL